MYLSLKIKPLEKIVYLLYKMDDILKKSINNG